MRKAAAGLLLLAVAGCSRMPGGAAGPDFHPEIWFKGRMHSAGSLTVTLGKPHVLNVDSMGAPSADGAVRLDQAIHWAGGTVDRRYWIMRPSPTGGYDVTLTDAIGPVAFETKGPRAHLRYRDRHGPLPLMVEQWMDLRPDGRTLDNHGTLSVFGVPIAWLDEIIVHDLS